MIYFLQFWIPLLTTQEVNKNTDNQAINTNNHICKAQPHYLSWHSRPTIT